MQCNIFRFAPLRSDCLPALWLSPSMMWMDYISPRDSFFREAYSLYAPSLFPLAPLVASTNSTFRFATLLRSLKPRFDCQNYHQERGLDDS